jgi:hypothetical protein
MFLAGADAAGQDWADRWIEDMGQLYRLNELRIQAGRDLKAAELPAPFVRMDPERMNQPAYAHSQQALVQQVESMAQAREAQLAQRELRSLRRKILKSLGGTLGRVDAVFGSSGNSVGQQRGGTGRTPRRRGA